MIHVARTGISHPEVFYSEEIKLAQKRLEEFYQRSDSTRSQERYTRPFEPELRDKFLRALRELFNGKCAYCETKIESGEKGTEYDHFRPKSGARGFDKEFSNDHYWWLTYEWNNLYYCCSKCNQYKSTWFPVEGKRAAIGTRYQDIIFLEKALLLDPCQDDPEKHLTFSENGGVDFLTSKGKTTIEILKLNRAELISERENSLKELYGQWEFFLKLFYQKSRDNESIEKIALEWELIFGQISPKPFLAAQKQMLTKWISNYPDIQVFLSSSAYKITPITTLQNLSASAAEVTATLTDDQKKKIEEEVNLESIRHIYVEKIELHNFKCFSRLEIDFDTYSRVKEITASADGTKNEPWILFLGENGVGKTSILKALVLGLTGNEYIAELGVTGESILKQGEKEGSIKIHLVGAEKPIVVTFDNQKISTDLNQPVVNILAYNSIRLKPKIGKMVPEKSIFYGAKAKNLFDYTFSLVDSDNWIATLPKEVFDRVALTLKDLMLLDNDDRIDVEEYRVVLKRGNTKLYIDELSDGYQSVFYLAVDIMATLAGENVTFDLAEGMVLIDEIGTHLHPRWRMEVVGRLRKAFPRIRFVVTTHEPLCLRGLKAGETVVLAKALNNEVVALTDLPDPSKLRIDQILTSEFFGLNSTIDPETEKMFSEYYSILALDEVDRTEEQKTKLIMLSETIPKIKHLGDSLREELVYYVVDELLAKKVRSDGLKLKADLKQEAIKRIENIWKEIP